MIGASLLAAETIRLMLTKTELPITKVIDRGRRDVLKGDPALLMGLARIASR
jgi:hypothetical protein